MAQDNRSQANQPGNPQQDPQRGQPGQTPRNPQQGQERKPDKR